MYSLFLMFISVGNYACFITLLIILNLHSHDLRVPVGSLSRFKLSLPQCNVPGVLNCMLGRLTPSDFRFLNQNVLAGAILFFWNQYSNIVRTKLSSTALTVRVIIKK